MPCIRRAPFGTRNSTCRASTPYGYYIVIKAGGGVPEQRRATGIGISTVVTDVFQTGSAPEPSQ